jgi:hypothetical protein
VPYPVPVQGQYTEAASTLTSAPLVPPVVSIGDAAMADAMGTKPKKAVRCWKCAVNTHAVKDCKVIHYCLVCDTTSHPTAHYPILKLPKLQGYFVGCGDASVLDVHLPDSVYKPHLIPTGALLPLLVPEKMVACS